MEPFKSLNADEMFQYNYIYNRELFFLKIRNYCRYPKTFSILDSSKRYKHIQPYHA